jgi:catalase
MRNSHDGHHDDAPVTTNDAGSPVGSDEHSITVGPDGPVLLQDAYLIEKFAHFVRERRPSGAVRWTAG